MPNTVHDLTGQWQFKEYPANARRMRDLDSSAWLPTPVPSSIYTSLINVGKIDPTELNTDPEKFISISQKPWIYRKIFTPPTHLFDSDRIDLLFEGLDTIADIRLNDKLLAKTDNMFIRHRFDITNLLKPNRNCLLVKFSPPADYAQKLMHRYGKLSESYLGYPSRAYIRKAQYQFGWDFCPPLPGCGIFRPVRLEAVTTARIQDVHIRTINCAPDCADVRIAIKLDTENCKPQNSPLLCKLNITGHDQNIERSIHIHPHHDHQSIVIHIDNPKFWWPKGYGPQNMYKLDIELTAADRTIDHVTKHLGLRTLKLDRSKDTSGENFQFEINNQKIYAKGANWIPPSIFPGSAQTTDYENLLNLAADANINMLRIWGGGYYESDEFYQICDRLGIMVWQDFMFACAYYPDRKWFADSIKKESSAIIKQLRNHPSLVIWCGNNEIDWLHAMGQLGKGKKFYGKAIYHNLLPNLIAELDPDRDYIPTTPIGPDKDPNSPNSGTTHQWNVWSGNQPAGKYITPPEKTPRFVTEFGLQSLPNPQTIETFCPADQLRIGTQTLEKHNYQLDGNSRLARYLADLFPPPADLESFAYLTQLTQARAVKKFVEHLRANNKINKGVLFWQFNDCAPAITWSAIDYTNTPKALYYYARRFFAPILITLISNHNNIENNMTGLLHPKAAVVINDTPNPLTVTMSCRLMDLKGQTIDRITSPLALAPFTTSTPVKLPKAISKPQDQNQRLLALTLHNQHGTIAENLFSYLPDKYIDYPDPKINTTLTSTASNQYKLSINSDTIVRDLQIITPPSVSNLNDNFINLLPKTDYEITFNCPHKPTSVEKKIQLRHIATTLY